MKHNTWKMIAIVLMAVVGALIIFAIVPGLVALVTTLHIINVDTNSQWISFWGNYLGAITGGALIGGFAIYVMLNTIKNSRADQRKQDARDFMRYLTEKSSEIFTYIETAMYNEHQCIVERVNGKKNIEKVNQFLNHEHSARVICYNLYIQLDSRKKENTFKGNSVDKLCLELYEMIQFLDEYASYVLKAEEIDEALDKKLADLTNNLANELPKALEEINNNLEN